MQIALLTYNSKALSRETDSAAAIFSYLMIYLLCFFMTVLMSAVLGGSMGLNFVLPSGRAYWQ